MNIIGYVTKPVATALIPAAMAGFYLEAKELQEQRKEPPPEYCTSVHLHERTGTEKPGDVRQATMRQATTTTATPWAMSAGW
jgi:hypothetical protein